ncbi:MAG: thioredoxin family protein [Bryobacteraceae bacterium]
MAGSQTAVHQPKIVSQAEWLAARKDHLAKEKEFTRLRDELSRQRRELPWEKVEKAYVFDGPNGKETLAGLFETRSQLIVYHFMLGPGWKEGCQSCSFLADHFDGAAVHLANRDVTLAVVSRAPLAQIETFKLRMGWRFKWVSSFGSDFNYDYHVSFTKDEIATGQVNYNYSMSRFPSEEAPGASVFHKDGNRDIFHTYSTYGRGLDILLGTYNFLDIAPKGRDEDGLAFSMSWVRHHDRYADGYFVDPAQPYSHPEISDDACCSGKSHS